MSAVDEDIPPMRFKARDRVRIQLSHHTRNVNDEIKERHIVGCEAVILDTDEGDWLFYEVRVFDSQGRSHEFGWVTEYNVASMWEFDAEGFPLPPKAES